MNKEQQYLIYLINQSIIQQPAELAQQPFNWKYFCNYAYAQQYEQLLFPLFKAQRPEEISEETFRKIHQYYGKAIVRDSKQDMALSELSSLLSEAKIKHIPLKGSVIKNYYPQPELRRSGDIDILVHEEDIEKAARILESIGYKRETKDQHMHDSFIRKPIHIELHRNLTGCENTSYEWCLSVWDYVYPKSEYEYVMEPEFLYVYLLVHLKHHIVGMGGGGIKLITDFAVLDGKINLNKDKLDMHLKNAHAVNFASYVEALAGKWFKNTRVTDENVLLLEDMILNSGAYGNYDKYMYMKLADGVKNKGIGKFKNMIRLLFPSSKSMGRTIPILRKYPVLLPFFWTKRIIFSKKEHRKSMVNSMTKLDYETSKKLSKFNENIQK